MDDARATPGITFACGATTFRIPASALELAIDEMDGAEEQLAAFRRQNVDVDHENMARIAYLSKAALREVTQSISDLEKAIFLLSLAQPAPVADPSPNDVDRLDKALRQHAARQTPGRRLRKVDRKKMRALVSSMKSCAVVALEATIAERASTARGGRRGCPCRGWVGELMRPRAGGGGKDLRNICTCAAPRVPELGR
jgi:hypothetical protein